MQAPKDGTPQHWCFFFKQNFVGSRAPDVNTQLTSLKKTSLPANSARKNITSSGPNHILQLFKCIEKWRLLKSNERGALGSLTSPQTKSPHINGQRNKNNGFIDVFYISFAHNPMVYLKVKPNKNSFLVAKEDEAANSRVLFAFGGSGSLTKFKFLLPYRRLCPQQKIRPIGTNIADDFLAGGPLADATWATNILQYVPWKPRGMVNVEGYSASRSDGDHLLRNLFF